MDTSEDGNRVRKELWEGARDAQGINGVRTGVVFRSTIASFTTIITALTSIIVSRCFENSAEVFRDISQL